MAYELQNNKGALFKNDKGGNDKRPDYRGDLVVEGVMYELAGWLKEGKKGKFFSLSVQPKRDRPAKTESKTPPPDDSDIPF